MRASVCQLVFQFLLLFEICSHTLILRFNWYATAAAPASNNADDDFYGQMNEKLAQITDYAQNAYDHSVRSAFDASMAAHANSVQQQLNKLHSAESFNEIQPPPPSAIRSSSSLQQQQNEQGNGGGGGGGTPNTVQWLTDSLQLKHTAPYCCDDDHHHVLYDNDASAAEQAPISTDQKDNHKIDEQYQQQQIYSDETSGGRNLNEKQLDWAEQNRYKFKRFLTNIHGGDDINDNDADHRPRLDENQQGRVACNIKYFSRN